MSDPAYRDLEEKIRRLEEVESRLRESEEKFRLAFNMNPDSINLNRMSDGMYLDINEGFTRLMGYSRDEVIGRTSIELKVWNDAADRDRLVKGLSVSGFVNDLEASFKRKNGDIGIGLMSARVLRINQEMVILSITRDITARKRMEEKLRESEYRYRTLFEKTSDAIFIVEKKTGLILDVNAAATRLTGREAHALIGTQSADLMLEAGGGRFESASKSEEAIDFGRIEYVRPDASRGTAILGTVPLDRERIFAIARDITQEAILEEQFRQAQKMEAIGRLAGGVAHDFNNLLVPIICYSEIGMKRLSADDPLYEHFKFIREAGDQAASLTRQILAFSRKQVLELKSLDLNDVIENLKTMLVRIIGEDITFTTSLAGTLPPVRADRSQMEQVLMNLAINARDAMPDGGKLVIETDDVVLDEHYAHKHIDVKPGNYVLIAVSDTGTGMTPETVQRIFEPFFSTKSQGKGTGLGLATVFGIVKQHNGHIWVYSEPGHGTTFKIYLPHADSRPAVKTAAPPEPEPAGAHGTILVVDDDDRIRRIMCESLAACGYSVLDAKTPSDGIKRVSDSSGIDLLITDVVMPQMNGRELFSTLRADYPGIRVLYISGYTDNVIVHHGILEDNVNFLQKPFTLADLARKVTVAFSRSG